jgi:two-component system LytT family response regulator
MKILIVDDERRARESAAQAIKLYSPIETEIVQAEGVYSALVFLQNTSVDLILLDIQLKDGSGFDVIEKMPNKNIPLIFITAHDEFAIKAFKVSAIDYLLKPIDPDELVQAILKSSTKFNNGKQDEHLALLLETRLRKEKQIEKIVLRTSDSIHVIAIPEISYCEADKNYTTFYLIDRPKVVVSKNIGEYEDLLASNGFLRIHQSILLNLDQLEKYEKGDGGFVLTKSGQQLPVSSRKKEQLMAYLNLLG